MPAKRCLPRDHIYVTSHSIMSSPMRFQLGENIALRCFHFQIANTYVELINSRYTTNCWLLHADAAATATLCCDDTALRKYLFNESLRYLCTQQTMIPYDHLI